MVKIYNLHEYSIELQKLKRQFTVLENILHKNNIFICKKINNISIKNFMSYLSDSSIETNNKEKINIFYQELQEKEGKKKKEEKEEKEEEEENEEKNEEENEEENEEKNEEENEEEENDIEILKINKYKINFLLISIKDKIEKIDDNLSKLYYNYTFCNPFKNYEIYIKRKNFEKEKLIEIEKKKYLLFLLKNIEKILSLHNN